MNDDDKLNEREKLFSEIDSLIENNEITIMSIKRVIKSAREKLCCEDIDDRMHNSLETLIEQHQNIIEILEKEVDYKAMRRLLRFL